MNWCPAYGRYFDSEDCPWCRDSERGSGDRGGAPIGLRAGDESTVWTGRTPALAETPLPRLSLGAPPGLRNRIKGAWAYLRGYPVDGYGLVLPDTSNREETP